MTSAMAAWPTAKPRATGSPRSSATQRAMMMGSHGVLVAAATVAEAFDTVYYLERACQTLVLAYSTGRPLNMMSDAVAEKTAQEWEEYAGMASAHFAEMKRILDTEDASYAD